MRTCVFHTAITAIVLAGCGGGLGGGGSQTCEYSSGFSTTTLPKFSLSVTLPDGSVQSCATLRSPDAGSPFPRSAQRRGFRMGHRGRRHGVQPGHLRRRDWLQPAGLSVRDRLARPDRCVAAGPASHRDVAIFFRRGAGVPTGARGQRRLAIGVASGTWPALWLAAADSTVQSSIPLPFSVVQQALSCNPNPSPTHPCGGAAPPDDYALVFTPASGEPPLSLATGKTGTLTLTPAPGLQQHLTVHNLRSYQTENCDDYWTWGWWAAGHAGASGQLE